MLSFSHLLFMSTFGARFAAHVYIYRIQYIHIAHIMPWQGRYKRGQAGRQDTAGQGRTGQGRKGRTDCNLYDIHNDILRTNAPGGAPGRARKGGQVEGIYKEWYARAEPNSVEFTKTI